MKIVVLDGYTTNPGDLTWQALHEVAECEIYDRTAVDQIVERAHDAEFVLTNKTPLDATTLAKLPALKYIGVLATGYNVVDTEAAKARGVAVTNIPAYGTESVAQMVFALLLELTQHVGHHARTVREGKWSASPDFCYWDYPLIELHGLTLGVIGFGHIGQAVARLGQAFGMKVVAHRKPKRDPGLAGVTYLELDELLQQSDVVTLHSPLTDQTRHLIDAERLALMKPSAFLINTARGPLVHEDDLADALNSGRLAGAGLDVLSVEPPSPDNPLLSAKNCLITPHIAWATEAARKRLLGMAVENIQAFVAGESLNRIV